MTIDGSTDMGMGSSAERVARVRSLAIAGEDRGPGTAGRDGADGGRRGRRLLVAVIAAQALGLAWLAAERLGGQGGMLAPLHAAAAAAPAAPQALAALPAAAGGAPVRFEAQGFVVATRRATVSTRVAGIVTTLPVEVGDRVHKSQVLGTLDVDLAERELLLAQKQLKALEAHVRSAEASQRQAAAELEQEQSLQERRFSSAARVLQKRTGADVAGATLDNARADLAVGTLQVQQQRSLLSNYTIRAPFAGIVSEKNAQPGELIAPSGAGGGFTRTGLCTIVDTDSLEVQVDVSEQLVNRVREGQPVQFVLYAYEDKVLRGRVARVMPSADRAKGTLQVRVAILDRDPRILPDMRVRLDFL
jgi:HlyD family secretion protein